MDETYVCIIEYVGGVEEGNYTTRITWTFNHVQGNMSNVENVHVQHSTVVHLEVTQLVVIQVQVESWKTHNHNSICWGFFIVNDGLLVNLLNPPML
jgi:hypothetical protein